MKSRDFCYWLMGRFEIVPTGVMPIFSSEEVLIIKKHLDLVFAHEIDPSAGSQSTQDTLNAIHSGENPNILMRC